jgi:hypothetical protein
MYVAANAVDRAIDNDSRKAGRDPGEYTVAVARHFASLPADRFPTIAALLPLLTSGDGEERFVFGLDLLISGLAAQAG